MKTFKKFTVLIASVALIAQSAFAANIGDDTVKIGRPGSSANKTIQMGAGRVRWNQSTSKLTFSNDSGGSFKNLGSGGGGGGGGINVLQDFNFDFEGGTANWTKSSDGSTFTTATTGTNLIFDAQSGVFNSSASGQTVSSQLVAIPEGFKGANGSASCYFKTTASDYKLQVFDGTNVLAERTIPAISGAPQKIATSFVFPSSGSIRLRVISASDAADLALDNCHLGETQMLQIGQATEYAASTTSAGGGCSAFESVSVPMASVVANAAGCTRTFRGQGTELSNPLELGLKVASLPKGKYSVSLSGGLSLTGTGVSAGFYEIYVNTLGVGVSIGELYCGSGITCRGAGGKATFEVPTTLGPTEIKVRAADGAAVKTTAVTADFAPVTIALHKYPSEASQAQTFDTVAWRVEALQRRSPTGIIQLGTATVAQSPVVVTSADAMQIVSNLGSVSARQLCDGVAASGATCAGDSVVGIEFTPPAAGAAKVCAQFSHYILTSGSNASTFFRLDGLNSTASSITTAGIQGHYASASATTGNISRQVPMRICENKIFTSVSPVRIGLTRENIVALANNEILDTGILWTVEPINQQVPAPVIVGGVVSDSVGVEKLVRASLTRSAACTSSPCAIASQSGGISSVTRTSAGLYTVNFSAGTFSGVPACVASGADTGPGLRLCYGIGAPTSTTFDLACVDGAITNSDAAFDLTCQGPK